MTRSVLNSASFADNSVTTAKIADNAVTYKKTVSEELKPVWHNLQYASGGNSSHRFMDNYCTRMNSNNGNNGPAALAMLEGSTGTGPFQIEYIPGYSWGWSGIYLTDRNGLNIDATTGEFVTSGWWRQQPPGYKQIWTGNNSSNNLRYTTLWDGSSTGSGNLISSPSGGTNGATWYIWRNSSGLVRVSDSTATTTIIASGDTTDWVVSSATEQSPGSCQIVMAKRIYGS